MIPKSIIIDGEYDQERYVVYINHKRLRLRGVTFRYLVRLAHRRVVSESGWIYREDIEPGDNQPRYIYRMRNEITAQLGPGWQVVENNRLGYYRLLVSPRAIAFNAERLEHHPDFDVRSLFVRAKEA